MIKFTTALDDIIHQSANNIAHSAGAQIQHTAIGQILHIGQGISHTSSTTISHTAGTSNQLLSLTGITHTASAIAHNALATHSINSPILNHVASALHNLTGAQVNVKGANKNLTLGAQNVVSSFQTLRSNLLQAAALFNSITSGSLLTSQLSSITTAMNLLNSSVAGASGFTTIGQLNTAITGLQTGLSTLMGSGGSPGAVSQIASSVSTAAQGIGILQQTSTTFGALTALNDFASINTPLLNLYGMPTNGTTTNLTGANTYIDQLNSLSSSIALITAVSDMYFLGAGTFSQAAQPLIGANTVLTTTIGTTALSGLTTNINNLNTNMNTLETACNTVAAAFAGYP